MPTTADMAVPILIEDVATQPISMRGQILIVDDVPANLIALEVALAPLQRPLVKAGSGREALAHLLEKDFSLVLMDVQMPDMNGFETAELIRGRERTRHLPIIFVTAGEQDPAAVLRAYQLGAVDFLYKPLEPAILLAKTSVFVTLQDRTEELASERFQREFDAARRDYETEALRKQMEHEHAAKEELARLNTALAEIDRRKDSFLAILGHELRNPLAPMRTAIDLARENPDLPLSARTLDILDRQTHMLTRLVEDLLDVSRINTNKIELRPEPIDLRTVVADAIATSRPAIEQRGHVLSTVIAEAPIRVVADQVRLIQIITNLLNNAARYTERGGAIEVVCGIERERAFVRVSDSGIGVPAELMPKIFDMFVQERVRSDGSGGLGLGLALARKLIEMHRGTIRAHSAGRGAGSTFEIMLPLEGSDDVVVARTRSEAMKPLARGSSPQLRTVVIDDNEDARELVADLLRSRGHAVMTAADGYRGLAMIREHRPDVALVDLGLPGIDGVTLAHELRAQCPELTTRLVALTGYGHVGDVERTKEAGFHAHLVKPATLAAILAALAPPTDL
ncbi:MAG: response regulator receiver sensor hybrid histidine kinase [Myxococcales bacterium]|nr:response regulator receiver sensor hybrid histidine kinase [Myxococcales bacterium]